MYGNYHAGELLILGGLRVAGAPGVRLGIRDSTFQSSCTDPWEYRNHTSAVCTYDGINRIVNLQRGTLNGARNAIVGGTDADSSVDAGCAGQCDIDFDQRSAPEPYPQRAERADSGRQYVTGV